MTEAIAQGMADLLPAKPTFTVDCSTNLDPLACLKERLSCVFRWARKLAVLVAMWWLIDVGDGSWTPEAYRAFH